MKVEVDRDVCEGHGQCEFAAPEVFTVDDDGTVSWNATPDDGERTKVQQAVRLCPVQAIMLRD